MESFLQPEPYYSGRDLFYLSQKLSLSDPELLYYCACLRLNQFRFNYGRQANQTLAGLLIPSPDSIPEFVDGIDLNKYQHENSNQSFFAASKNGKEGGGESVPTGSSVTLDVDKWDEFLLEDLFEVESSDDPLLKDAGESGETPYISSTEYNNGISALVSLSPSNKGNVLTVNRGGSVGKTFYQPRDFLATKVDVRILKPKFALNPYIGLFLATVIENEKYRFNYSRKMGTARLKKLKVKLPSTSEGQPSWQFMEDYIKSLPYSSSL